VNRIFKFISLSLLLTIFEIAGGWLTWRALNSNRPLRWGLVGILIFIFFVIASTAQPTHFGRIYAAYGGFFIALSLIWGMGLDGVFPDRYDLIGTTLSLTGLGIMFYMPRG
jgi:small multidrug resistance family-3 protein